MIDLLRELFGQVCGQGSHPAWTPGGTPLICCQRCLGLYVGGLAAWALHLCWKPRLSRDFLAVHGALILLLAPFGWHWLPENPWLRTLTGFLCGAGIATFLWLVPATKVWRHPQLTPAKGSRKYAFGLGAASVGLLLAVQYGGTAAAWALNWLAAAGLVAFGALAILNIMPLTAGVLPRPGQPKTRTG